MNLEDARSSVISALARMAALYRQPVFDEWVLVSMKAERGAILAYQGPRADTYKKSFTADIQPLRAELEGTHLAVGDFAFVQSATGTRHDACLRAGESGYLFCNNTTRTMEDIRKNPLWLSAQKAFVELSDKFRRDPME